MSAALTRRGFAKVAGAGLAALCFPSPLLSGRAHASAAGVLASRWELSPQGLEITLFVRSALSGPVEVVLHAVEVRGELRIGDARHPLSFTSEGRETQRRSRAGFRLNRRAVAGVERDTPYDRFSATWPAGVPRSGILALETALRPEVERLDEDARSRLVDLDGLHFELPVVSST